MNKKTPIGITKIINNNNVYLHKSFDVMHGFGWFCQIYFTDYKIGFGFDNKSKFTAYRKALKNKE
jgi:hypothetical protein